MNIISYALFGSRDKTLPRFEFNSYLRGLYWNVRMNALIYPSWTTHVELDSATFSDYDNIFNALHEHYGMTYAVNPSDNLCKSMLWRLKPIWFKGSEYVLCRDTDAITTFREAQCVKYHLHCDVQSILDNPSHSGIMGGMCGFKSEAIKERFPTYQSLFDQYLLPINERGTDQIFLNKKFVQFQPEIIDNLSYLDQSSPLWESNLTCRHIGSAGVVEMETIRFYKRFEGESKIIETEKKYPLIFNWHE